MASKATWWDLHVALQDAFAWEDRHLHEFDLGPGNGRDRLRVGLPYEDDATLPGWERSLTGDFDAGLQTCMYMYDFGDDWHVALAYEDRVHRDHSYRWSRCVSGACAAPLEDSGGLHGYYDMLAARGDRRHPMHEDAVDWLPKGFESLTLRRAHGSRERPQEASEGDARSRGRLTARTLATAPLEYPGTHVPSPLPPPPGPTQPVPRPPSVRATSAYYAAPVSVFLASGPQAIIGQLTMADPHRALESTQKLAWAEEVQILREALNELDSEATLFLEFDVPRLGSRIDAVVVAGPVVCPIEFKCGEKRFTTAAYNQAWDYGLDLKNFHLASHAAPVFPMLVATRAQHGDTSWAPPASDDVRPPRRVAPGELGVALAAALKLGDGPMIRRRRVGPLALPADTHDRRSGPGALLAALRAGHHAQRRRRQEPAGHLRHGRGDHRAVARAAR